jgi:tRNA(Ser,Leu) C12 N-acetylase TAN1
MREWNVVVTVREPGYNQARKLLERFGEVSRTDYFNILLMQVAEPLQLLDLLRAEAERDPASVQPLARVMPVFETFIFQTPAQFEEKARQAVDVWLPSLAGKSFYLRMHRRGFKGKLSGMEEEKFLDTYLLEQLDKAGSKGKISFEDPDAVIVLETVGPRAGLSFWTRDHLKRYPLLHPD